MRRNWEENLPFLCNFFMILNNNWRHLNNDCLKTSSTRHELLGVESLNESFPIVINIIARHGKSYGFLGEISCRRLLTKIRAKHTNEPFFCLIFALKVDHLTTRLHATWFRIQNTSSEKGEISLRMKTNWIKSKLELNNLIQLNFQLRFFLRASSKLFTKKFMRDKFQVHHPYFRKISYDFSFGFSTQPSCFERCVSIAIFSLDISFSFSPSLHPRFTQTYGSTHWDHHFLNMREMLCAINIYDYPHLTHSQFLS